MAETPASQAPNAHGDGVPPVIAAWHDLVHTKDPDALRALIADDAVFCSPAVHAPQVGGKLTFAYLSAALTVLGPTIEYLHEWYDADSAVLRFRARLGDRDVDGVDIIRWNAENRITEFTVMVRPLSGLHALIEQMKAQLGA